MGRFLAKQKNLKILDISKNKISGINMSQILLTLRDSPDLDLKQMKKLVYWIK